MNRLEEKIVLTDRNRDPIEHSQTCPRDGNLPFCLSREITDTLSAICTILYANLRFLTISCAIARCWASTLARGAIMQELMPSPCGAGSECNRAISTARLLFSSVISKKSLHSAPRRFWCAPLRSCEGPLVAAQSRSWDVRLRCRWPSLAGPSSNLPMMDWSESSRLSDS